ncbi:MAG: hypothetical protein H0W89_06700 [Candidatus Levybacteria bacterium]|nr:hypothetical protein [Candidatus Levybacteria bacterium]
MLTPDRPTRYPRTEAVIVPESRNIVLPDARIVLERFDKMLLPQIGAFVIPQPEERRLFGDELHAQYAVFSRLSLEAFTGLDLFRVRAKVIAEGDDERYVGGELHGMFRVKKSPVGILIRSTLGDDSGNTVETNYQQVFVGVGTGDRRQEEVTFRYSDRRGDRNRSVRLELGERTYTLRSQHLSNGSTASITESTFNDTPEGLITGATFSVKTHDGNS